MNKCSSDDVEHGRTPRSSLVSPEALERAARLFRAMGDVPRLRVLSLLAQGEACVTELAGQAEDELSTMSQRLRVLRSENLVVRRRDGKHINYSLADQHIMDLIFNALAHASESPPAPQARPADVSTKGKAASAVQSKRTRPANKGNRK